MAFERQISYTPTAIGQITIYLTSPQEGNGRADYAVEVVYNNGDRKLMTGDLVPHLSQAQITALLGFMADMRTKAIAEILPPK